MDDDRGRARREDRCLECGRRILSGYLCFDCDDVSFRAEPESDD